MLSSFGSSSQPAKQKAKILVNVYYPGKWILRVNVLLSANCYDINKFINNFDVKMVFNGTVLQKRHSFRFYGLKNEDILLVVPKDEIGTMKSVCENIILEDDEAFKEKISHALNPKMSDETGRIRDLQLAKIENKPGIYRRLVSLFESEQNTPQNTVKTPSFIPKKAEKPSTQPLPCFWTEEKTPIAQRTTDETPLPIPQLKEDECSPIPEK